VIDARVVEDVWRRESAHVLAALLRRHGDLGDCEDAAQEALAAATVQWEADGVPDHPRGWLLWVASRRLVDQLRADRLRAAREVGAATREPATPCSPPRPTPRRRRTTASSCCSCAATRR